MGQRRSQMARTWEQRTHQSDRTANVLDRPSIQKITEMMDLWVSKAMSHGILLTGEVLRQKWNNFADLVGIP